MLGKTDIYFLTIVESGNLNKASQKLYVAQPSLSKYIRRLESHLGTELFDRTVSPMKLTEAGKLYLTYLKDAMERKKQLLEQIQEINQQIRGTLRLGIPPFFGQCWLPKVLPAFSKQFPHVQVELHEGIGSSIELALANQKLDLAILPYPITSDALAYEPLIQEQILLAVKREPGDGVVSKPGNLQIQPGSQSLFRGKPTILPHPEQRLGKLVQDYFSAINYAPPVYTSTQNAATALSLAASGMGVTFVPDAGLDTVSEDIISRLRFYTLAPEMSVLQFVSVTRKGADSSVYAKALLEQIKTYGSEEKNQKMA